MNALFSALNKYSVTFFLLQNLAMTCYPSSVLYRLRFYCCNPTLKCSTVVHLQLQAHGSHISCNQTPDPPFSLCCQRPRPSHDLLSSATTCARRRNERPRAHFGVSSSGFDGRGPYAVVVLCTMYIVCSYAGDLQCGVCMYYRIGVFSPYAGNTSSGTAYCSRFALAPGRCWSTGALAAGRCTVIKSVDLELPM